MRKILYVSLTAILIAAHTAGAGIFDRLKEKADEAVREAVDEALDSTRPEQPAETDKEANTSDSPQHEQKTAAGSPIIQTPEDLYGRWEGVVAPSAKGYNMMSGMTLYITITPEFAGMRVSGAGTRCLAELEPTDTFGRYEATFIDETQSCGSRATVSFAADGTVTVNWHDMPNTSADDNTYSGQLTKKTPPYERRWSTSRDERNSLDVVGLRLGMTYEETLDYLKANHADLAQTLNFVKDTGTTSIILKMAESTAKKVGPAVYGEQLTLVFESQTPDEMEVEQDPAVLDAIEERKKIIEQRQELAAQQRSARRTRTRGTNPEPQSPVQLPQIPEMPMLRPTGADAELVVISRQIQYGNRQGPHPDNVLGAMGNKYGRPSIRIKKSGSTREQYLVGWVYDAAGEFVPDAKDSACDLLSVTGYDLKERARHYTVLNNVPNIYYPVMISPHCGLTLISDIRTENDGSVWRIAATVYDQQRLLGDEWYRTHKLTEALIAQQKAKSGAVKQRDVPDF